MAGLPTQTGERGARIVTSPNQWPLATLCLQWGQWGRLRASDEEYPSILSGADMLGRFEGQPFVAFEKLDGSNIRAEWDGKRGWHQFGSRKRLLEASQPVLGRAIQLVLDGYGDDLAQALARRGVKQATAYFEFFGPHSFAGIHAPARLGVGHNDPLRVVLIDVNLHKRGLVSAEEFIAQFGHLGIPRVVHRGELRGEFIADVRAGKFGEGEGVICKGGEGHGRWMAKVKTEAYLRRLMEFFGGDWAAYWE